MNIKELALQKIISTMHLRTPQRIALEHFHDVINSADMPLSQLSLPDVCKLFMNSYPSWNFDRSSPEFTFHLATGVGKTRLIGAIIAYLYLSEESKNFVIVSPRSEIIRKFNDVCIETSNDYLFVDRTLFGTPELMNADSVMTYDSIVSDSYTGPKLWILTPQSLSTKGAKLKEKSEYDVCSAVEYLQGLDDLVVFFDESHHLGYDKKSDSVWRAEIQALNPKMVIGTTASVDSPDTTNVIYSYDLKQCLNEKKYTKLVRIIADKKDDSMSDDDFDNMVLRYAWDQLQYKQRVLDDYAKSNGIEKRVKAVMLVACQDITHAQQVTGWLQRMISKQAVLLVHSKMKESEFLPSLQNIEDPSSPVKIVVNVSKLTEGWDVSNIYVIAPLRAMASSTLVTQVMGRGLRLPYGKQTGNEEVDTLDVLCFGRETMQDICDKLLSEGFGVNTGAITIEQKPDSGKSKPFIPTKKYPLKVVKEPRTLKIPSFRLERPLLDLAYVSIPSLKAADLHAFYISDPRTIRRLNGSMSFDRSSFLGLVSSELLKQCAYLSFAKHYRAVMELVDRFTTECGFKGDDISLEPEKVINHIKRSLDSLSRQVPANYIDIDETQVIELANFSVNVPESFSEPLNSITFDTRQWATRTHRGIPFSGWTRSLFEAIPFDQVNELKIAKIIDRSEEVSWWFRNLPGLITLPTPAGNYSPDFAIFFSVDELNVLLEIKGDIYYGQEDEDATIKANAAREWCRAQSNASSKKWQYWFLLDSDADICTTFDDIKDNADISDV